MSVPLDHIINFSAHPIDDAAYRAACKSDLDTNGVLLLSEFLSVDAIKAIAEEGRQQQSQAYYTVSDHNAYLQATDPHYPDAHPRNQKVTSSKGCITTDQIQKGSMLKTLYDSERFKNYLCAVLGESALYEYADPLSSINLHYASAGQELGWHYDNSSFAITLLIQKPEAGATFQYVTNVRNADEDEMNYHRTGQILDGKESVQALDINPGGLVLFRGRNSIHRVTPTIGDVTRMLVVLAYNTEPGVSLSESARQTFYGRLA